MKKIKQKESSPDEIDQVRDVIRKKHYSIRTEQAYVQWIKRFITLVALVLAAMSATYRLMAKLLYGCGLRLMECVRLRVKDIDFGQNQIMVRDGRSDDDAS